MKINPKSFAIPILTGYLADIYVAVRIGIANGLGFNFILLKIWNNVQHI